MHSLRAHLTAHRLALVLVLILVSADAIGTSRDLTTTATTAHSRAGSDAPSPTPSLALRPGARLAPERVLDFFSTPLALDYVITDQDAAPPDDGAGGPHASSTPGRGSGEEPGTATAETSAPVTPSDGAASATASAAPSSASSPAGAHSSPPSGAGHTVSLYSLLGTTALLVAAVTAALALRTARRRTQAGRDTDTAPSADSLTAADGPQDLMLLDRALRTMVHHHAQLPQSAGLPALRGAVIATTTTVELLPEDLHTEPPAPFTASDDGHWELPEGADLLNAETAAQVPAPYPSLVALGTTDDGELLLLNLASLRALLLDGTPEHIGEVCTALAVELATSPWSDHLDLITAGCGDGLAPLLPAVRITHAPDASHALHEASERLLETHQLPDTRQQPLLVLCASPLDTDTARQFADLTTTLRPRPLTLIAPAHTTALCLEDAPVLDASAHQAQYLEHLDAHVTLQRLTPAAHQEIATALRDAAATHPPGWHNAGRDTGQDDVRGAPAPAQGEQTSGTDLPTPGMSSVSGPPAVPTTPVDDSPGGEDGIFPALLTSLRPAGPGPMPDAAPASDRSQGSNPAETTPTAQPPAQAINPQQPGDTSARRAATAVEGTNRNAPQIRVLGPVEVDGVDTGGHGPRIAQLAALLYFKPGRTADTLRTDMDPAHPWSTTTLNARLHGLRSALGKDPTGHPYVPRRKTGDDPYHLHPAITCDWTYFQHLTQHLAFDGPDQLVHVERLEEALALVRGTPFDGKALPWAEPLQQEMTTAITDVAHTIATRRLNPGPQHDLDKARQAVSHGIDVDDSAEILYRDWILVEEAAGNRHGVHTAITRIQHINRSLNRPLEEDTERLINTLHGPARHT